MPYPAEALPSEPDDGTEYAASAIPELDRVVLKELTDRALEPQTYYGKGFDLTEVDREQLGLVVSSTQTILEPSYEDPAWKDFQDLVDEGQGKGVLMSFNSHKGTNVPTWCVDGGDGAAVGKIRTPEGRAAIEVPSRIYHLYHWDRTAAAVDKIAASSDEVLHGRSTKPLGNDLRQLSHLLKPSPDTE